MPTGRCPALHASSQATRLGPWGPSLSLTLRWRLTLLQLMLLLCVSLRQLLSLLLVLLLQLLFLRIASPLFLQFLMVLVLLLLEFLAFLVLLGLQLLLLFLVFLVEIRVPSVWSGGVFGRWKIVGVDCRVGAGCVVFRARGRFMNRSALSGCYDSATFEFSRLSRRSNGRLAVVCGGAKFGVRTCGLDMLGLRSHRGDMPIMCRRFFLGSGTRVDAAVSTIEADVVDDGFVHSGVVNVVNHIDVDV